VDAEARLRARTRALYGVDRRRGKGERGWVVIYLGTLQDQGLSIIVIVMLLHAMQRLCSRYLSEHEPSIIDTHMLADLVHLISHHRHHSSPIGHRYSFPSPHPTFLPHPQLECPVEEPQMSAPPQYQHPSHPSLYPWPSLHLQV
jgi:hypothetical protein